MQVLQLMELQHRFTYTATAGQTTFTGADANGNTIAYDAGFVTII